MKDLGERWEIVGKHLVAEHKFIMVTVRGDNYSIVLYSEDRGLTPISGKGSSIEAAFDDFWKHFQVLIALDAARLNKGRSDMRDDRFGTIVRFCEEHHRNSIHIGGLLTARRMFTVEFIPSKNSRHEYVLGQGVTVEDAFDHAWTQMSERGETKGG